MSANGKGKQRICPNGHHHYGRSCQTCATNERNRRGRQDEPPQYIYPQYWRWMAEQRALIAQAGRDYPSPPLAIVDNPGLTEEKNSQNGFIAQEAKMLDQESVTAEYQKVLAEELACAGAEAGQPEGPHCEYCGMPLKEAKQARSIHLRYCKAYKYAKANNPAAPPRAAGTNGQDVFLQQAQDVPLRQAQDVLLTPERVSKLWQAITGGALSIEIENGQVICRVSKSSFDKALPILLDLL
jgi:hypothetical protein